MSPRASLWAAAVRIMQCVAVVAVTAVIASTTAGTLHAQGRGASDDGLELSAGVGSAQVGDSDRRLGTGSIVLAAGLSVPLWRKVRLSVDLDSLDHSRRTGTLSASGELSSGFVRATYLFGAVSHAVRPVVGGGLGVMHSTGSLVISGSGALAPNGQSLPSGGAWTTTRAALDVHAGLRIGLRSRLVIQPELRWRSTTAPYGETEASAIVPPVMSLQSVVTLGFRMR